MKDFLCKNKDKMFTIFIIMQPIIDCLTAICLNVFNIDVTFGLVVRMIFLLSLIFYNLLHFKEDRKTTVYNFLVFGYVLLYIGNIVIFKDMSVLFYELKNVVRYLYFPLLLINLYAVSKKKNLKIKPKTIKITYLIYIFLILVPMLTGTDFAGYFEGKVGSVGWFHSTNEIAAILSGLLPFIFFSSSKKISTVLILIPILIVLFSLGSKITILALGLTVLFWLVKMFINSKYKKKIVVFLVPLIAMLAVVGTILIPKTNFYKNIEIHLEFLEVDNILDIFKDEKLIDHFIFSSRLTFLSNTRENFLNSSLNDKILGIGFIENYATDEVNLKTIEMDLFDVFYRCGILGFIIYMLPIYIVLSKKFRKFKIEEMVALGLFTITSFLAGHVVTSPAVSIYFVIILLRLIGEESVENAECDDYSKLQ